MFLFKFIVFVTLLSIQPIRKFIEYFLLSLQPGHDLGLFSPGKLRSDLRNLLADQHSMEEEYEAAAAAATTAALVQLLNPPTPWRVQQRDIMRRIEQLNRQVLKKCQKGGRICGTRPPALPAPPTQPALPPSSGLTGNASGATTTTSPPTPVEKDGCAGATVSPAHASLTRDALASSTKLDLTCGFTEEDVTELLSQGIRPWDEEAPTVLAVLRGELDYLLE